MMSKVNFEELKNMDYQAGKEFLLVAGYTEAGSATDDATISDYVTDEYYCLYEDEEQVHCVSYERFYNLSSSEKDEDELVCEKWGEVE